MNLSNADFREFHGYAPSDLYKILTQYAEKRIDKLNVHEYLWGRMHVLTENNKYTELYEMIQTLLKYPSKSDLHVSFFTTPLRGLEIYVLHTGEGFLYGPGGPNNLSIKLLKDFQIQYNTLNEIYNQIKEQRNG